MHFSRLTSQALSISNTHPRFQPHQIFPSELYIITAFNYAVLWKCTPHFPVLLLLMPQVSTQMCLPLNIFNFMEELATSSSVLIYNIAAYCNTVLFLYPFLFFETVNSLKKEIILMILWRKIIFMSLPSASRVYPRHEEDA